MFSVGSSPERARTSSTYLRVGTAITDFNYTGTLLENPNANLLELSNGLFTFSFDTPGLSASAIIGNSLTGLKDQSFFDLNIRFTSGLRIVRQQKIQAGIPIQLSTGLTTSNNEFYSDRFSQTNFSGGAGVYLTVKFSPKIELRNEAIYGYGFSNSNGGFFGGNLVYGVIGSKLFISEFIGSRTLSIGYDYNLKSFDIDTETYDYDLKSHSITLGISL